MAFEREVEFKGILKEEKEKVSEMKTKLDNRNLDCRNLQGELRKAEQVIQGLKFDIQRMEEMQGKLKKEKEEKAGGHEHEHDHGSVAKDGSG